MSFIYGLDWIDICQVNTRLGYCHKQPLRLFMTATVHEATDHDHVHVMFIG